MSVEPVSFECPHGALHPSVCPPCLTTGLYARRSVPPTRLERAYIKRSEVLNRLAVRLVASMRDNGRDALSDLAWEVETGWDDNGKTDPEWASRHFADLLGIELARTEAEAVTLPGAEA